MKQRIRFSSFVKEQGFCKFYDLDERFKDILEPYEKEDMLIQYLCNTYHLKTFKIDELEKDYQFYKKNEDYVQKMFFENQFYDLILVGEQNENEFKINNVIIEKTSIFVLPIENTEIKDKKQNTSQEESGNSATFEDESSISFQTNNTIESNDDLYDEQICDENKMIEQNKFDISEDDYNRHIELFKIACNMVDVDLHFIPYEIINEEQAQTIRHKKIEGFFIVESGNEKKHYRTFDTLNNNDKRFYGENHESKFEAALWLAGMESKYIKQIKEDQETLYKALLKYARYGNEPYILEKIAHLCIDELGKQLIQNDKCVGNARFYYEQKLSS